ncbi:MAG: 16S rRNA (uracil(1498)-N(3))-methyltransferase [Pseudomonadota bacterium]
MGRVRLYVPQPLEEGQSLMVEGPQAHYLFGVMRLSNGAELEVFNGQSDGRLATVAEAGKRRGVLSLGTVATPFQAPPDLWLLFAPIKKARTDFIVEKSAEMGAARICPVSTDFTNSERIRQDRLQAHAVEAAEQCGGTYVPEVTDLLPLARMLDTWPEDRALILCDEGLAGEDLKGAELPSTPAAILIGPEGGFSDAERARLAELPFVTRISLGPRILRADTAVVAALALWQSLKGDW